MGSILDDIYRKRIALREPDIKTKHSIVNSIILTDFVNQMKQEDKVFSALYNSVYCTGSFYEGLKIIKPDEFDLNIVLDIPLRHFKLITHKDGDVPHGFAKYRSLGYNDNPENKFICDGFLSPKLLRYWFKGVFTKAFSKLHTNYEHRNYELVQKFEYTESGPAMTIRIILIDSGDEISIDLVPVIPIGDNDCIFLVPKLHPRNDLLWRLSYPDEELDILKNKSGPKLVIKLLKTLYHCSSLQKFCSYYIKMLVMLEVVENGSWEEKEVESYILFILKKLLQAMASGVLPSVHDREFNLFYLSDLNEIIRSNNCGQLKKIIKDIENKQNYEKYFRGTIGECALQSQRFGDIFREALTYNERSYHELRKVKDLVDILEEELPPPNRSMLLRYSGVPTTVKEVYTYRIDEARMLSRTLDNRSDKRLPSSLKYYGGDSVPRFSQGTQHDNDHKDFLEEKLPPPDIISLAINAVLSLGVIAVGGLMALAAYYLYIFIQHLKY